MCRKNLILLMIVSLFSLIVGVCFAKMMIDFFYIKNEILKGFIHLSSILIIFLFSLPVLEHFTD